MAIDLTPEQHSAVYDRGRPLLVSAGAGSGKTRVLVERLMAYMQGPNPCNIDAFLIITFTKAAAGELRGRIEAELIERAAKEPENRHLSRQLGLVARANIQTIDSFCVGVLREFSHLCGVIPGFRIAEGPKAEVLREKALVEALEQFYEQVEHNPDFAAFAEFMSGSKGDRQLVEAILETYQKTRSHPFPDRWMEEIQRDYEVVEIDFARTVWGSALLERACSFVKSWMIRLEEARTLLASEPKLQEKYDATFAEDLALSGRFLRATAQGWDSVVEVAAENPVRMAAAPRNFEPAAFKDRIKSIRDEWKEQYQKICAFFEEESEVHLAVTKALLPAVRGLFGAVRLYREQYDRIKEAEGMIDFGDAAHRTVRLLCEEIDGVQKPSAVADLIGNRYVEVMIDEFQDTNQIQNLLAEMLTHRRNNLFTVGDVKQSIYKFRLAEPEIFLRRYERYPFIGEAAPDEPAKINLSMNFRSRPEVTNGVNRVFETLMGGGFTQIRYGENERLVPGRIPEAEEKPGDPEYRPEFFILNLEKGEEAEEESPSKLEAEAGFVARKIQEYLDRRLLIRDGKTVRPLSPGDIAILLRSTETKANFFRKALEELGIPAQCEQTKNRTPAELNCIFSLLTVIDNAFQDIPLVGAMTSPAFGFTPDDLARIRAGDPKAALFEAVQKAAEQGDEKTAQFLMALKEYRRINLDFGVSVMIRTLYRTTGLPEIYSAMPNGSARKENLRRVYENSAEFLTGGRGGLSGFVRMLEKALADGSFPLARSAAEEGVSIMTIHKSKGMEFPVVFLSDLSSKFNLSDAKSPVLVHPHAGVGMKWLDRELGALYPTATYQAIGQIIREESLAEEIRVLYVAMTRAKDKLVLTCALPQAHDRLGGLIRGGCDLESLRMADGPAKWLIPIMASQPSAGELRSYAKGGEEYRPLPLEDWLVSLVELSQSPAKPVSPRESTYQMEGETCISAERPDGHLWQDEIRRRVEYVYPYLALADIPAKLTATQLKGKRIDGEILEGASRRPNSPGNLASPRFMAEEKGLTPAERGTAIHLAMQYADLSRCETLSGAAGELSRLGTLRILSPEQVMAVDADTLYRFASSPLGQRALHNPTLKREFKFSLLDSCARYYPDLPQEEQLLLQGVIDLYFEENGVITLVDFKSDRVPYGMEQARAEQYRPQIDTYTGAIERITGKIVAERVLFFLQTATPVFLDQK